MSSHSLPEQHARRHGERHAHRILVVDLEPTPYKTDLWNAFSDSPEVDLFVIYTERKNWQPDGGHNYLKWPDNRHAHVTMEGKGLSGALRSAMVVVRHIWRDKPDLVCIAGYVHIATVVALLCSIVLGCRFVMHADEFNNDRPEGRLRGLKWLVRESLRGLIFRFGQAVLVCGERGIQSARQAGCAARKILDFPYVIDVARMKRDEPAQVPPACEQDVRDGRPIIFFSGRMIPRKGLPTLLAALRGLMDKQWVLWVEGDGPELTHYQALAEQLGLQDRARFVGFCQFDLHSWLIRSSHIVVVPSHIDTWGIVVDEGLQLGKAVVSSDATGSGYDRVQDGHNGFIFPAGDEQVLARLLGSLIDDPGLCERVGRTAAAGHKNYGPADNLATLLRLINRAA